MTFMLPSEIQLKPPYRISLQSLVMKSFENYNIISETCHISIVKNDKVENMVHLPTGDYSAQLLISTINQILGQNHNWVDFQLINGGYYSINIATNNTGNGVILSRKLSQQLGFQKKTELHSFSHETSEKDRTGGKCVFSVLANRDIVMHCDICELTSYRGGFVRQLSTFLLPETPKFGGSYLIENPISLHPLCTRDDINSVGILFTDFDLYPYDWSKSCILIQLLLTTD